MKGLGPPFRPSRTRSEASPNKILKIIIPNLGLVEYEEKSYMGFGLPKLDFLFVPYVA